MVRCANFNRRGCDMNERESLLALHLTGVIGPRRLKAAREAFPEISDVFGASEDVLSRLPDWTFSCAQKILSFKDPFQKVEAQLEKAERAGITVLVEGDLEFPKVFENLFDPPFVLWRVGSYLPDDENAIAVIGCRKPSVYGICL